MLKDVPPLTLTVYDPVTPVPAGVSSKTMVLLPVHEMLARPSESNRASGQKEPHIQAMIDTSYLPSGISNL